jgi:hypothetical protein
MSDSGVYAFPTKLDDYKTNAKDQYLCALLPEEAKDIGVDQDLGIRWSLEKDDSEARFLRGEPTDEDARLVRSAQPGGDAAAEFKIAIPPEFYRSRENSPVFEMEKGDEVILEINEGSDPHFRLYNPSDYFGRQSSVNPRIKAPIIGGVAYPIYHRLIERSSGSEEPEVSRRDRSNRYRITFNVKKGDKRVENARVKFQGQEKTTNSYGRARFDVGFGIYKATVICDDRKKTKTFVASDENVREYYNVHVDFQF